MNVFDLLSMRGMEVKPSYADENEFKICCLFCGDMGEAQDDRFRCGFNIQSGIGHCFNCGWSSRKAILEIVRKLGGDSFDLDQVQKTPFTGETRKRPKKVELPEGFELLWKWKKERLAREAWEYVRSRGITEEQVKKHEIGIALYDSRFRDRIIFPVRDPAGKLLGVVGRDYTGEREPRYYNSAGLKYIYNANPLTYSKRWIILSEGIIKSLAIERAIQDKICSGSLLGAHVTNTKVACLDGFKEAILFPDPDRAGIKGFLGVAANLTTQIRVSMVWPWPLKQADEMSPKEIREVILGRRPYNQLLHLKMRQEIRHR
jgi:DNA primase